MRVVNAAVFLFFFFLITAMMEKFGARTRMRKKTGSQGEHRWGGFKSTGGHRAEPGASGTGWDADVMSRKTRDGARHQS